MHPSCGLPSSVSVYKGNPHLPTAHSKHTELLGTTDLQSEEQKLGLPGPKRKRRDGEKKYSDQVLELGRSGRYVGLRAPRVHSFRLEWGVQGRWRESW